MDKHQQVAHLHRRVGFGIAAEDRPRMQNKTIPAIVDEFLDFTAPSNFPIQPLEAFWDQENNFQNQPQRVAAWWALRMTFSSQPARDKLLLFAHDHFAVSAQKVENGYLMLVHLQALEANLNKPFADLLGAMTADPAMMVWLDLTTNIRGRPNENYARELLELFTLGIDSGYTEKDIQELARALTGWSIRVSIDGTSAESRKNQLLEAASKNWSVAAGTFADALHDPGPYTILGETKAFSTEEIHAKLAADPRTARHVTRKLLRYYLYPNPSEKTIEKYAAVFQSNQGNLAKTLRAIVEGEEFWSPEAEHAIIKSPVDYLIPMIRQLVPAEAALALRPKDSKLDTPIPQALFQIGGTLITLTNRMGMLPLFPPDVAGWNWGTGWISSASMVDRIRVSDVFTNQNQGQSAATKLTLLATQRKLKTNEELIHVILEIFDVKTNPESFNLLVKSAETQNLASKIGNLNATSASLRIILRTMFSMPSFQMM